MIAVVLLWVLGCSQTSVKTEWKDPGYQGSGVRALIVLCLPVDSKEKMCEDEFVRQLTEAGISATPGYSTSSAQMTRDAALQKAREKGVNRVLVSRFVATRQRWEPVWPESTNIHGTPDWGTYYDYQLEMTGYYRVFSTILYDAETDKAIWSADSDTFVESTEQAVMESYAKAMIKKLEHQGLLLAH